MNSPFDELTFVSERQMARRLGLSPATLMRLRELGDAPPHYVVQTGMRVSVRYCLERLPEWLEEHGYAA